MRVRFESERYERGSRRRSRKSPLRLSRASSCVATKLSSNRPPAIAATARVCRDVFTPVRRSPAEEKLAAYPFHSPLMRKSRTACSPCSRGGDSARHQAPIVPTVMQNAANPTTATRPVSTQGAPDLGDPPSQAESNSSSATPHTYKTTKPTMPQSVRRRRKAISIDRATRRRYQSNRRKVIGAPQPNTIGSAQSAVLQNTPTARLSTATSVTVAVARRRIRAAMSRFPECRPGAAPPVTVNVAHRTYPWARRLTTPSATATADHHGGTSARTCTSTQMLVTKQATATWTILDRSGANREPPLLPPATSRITPENSPGQSPVSAYFHNHSRLGSATSSADRHQGARVRSIT
jgi:hypothetical protein